MLVIKKRVHKSTMIDEKAIELIGKSFTSTSDNKKNIYLIEKVVIDNDTKKLSFKIGWDNHKMSAVKTGYSYHEVKHVIKYFKTGAWILC